MDPNYKYPAVKATLDPRMLAIEGNGAVQVDESPDKVPPIITLCGPIKVWWTEWGSERHQIYTEWRDAVRVALVKQGCAVYSPHRAIQGAWNEKLQEINDAAIKASDLIVVLTPEGVSADGTAAEEQVAINNGVRVYHCPPSGEEGIIALLKIIESL